MPITPTGTIWDDVPFSQADAAAAIDACERAHSSVASFRDSHDHAADMARPDWSGPHRARFDTAVHDIDEALAQAGAAVVMARQRIVEAAVAATLEQAAREVARAQWRAHAAETATTAGTGPR